MWLLVKKILYYVLFLKSGLDKFSGMHFKKHGVDFNTPMSINLNMYTLLK